MSEHTAQLEDIILQRRQNGNPQLEQLTIVLGLKEDNGSEGLGKGLKEVEWPQGYFLRLFSNSTRFVSILGGWLLRCSFAPEDLTDAGIPGLEGLIVSNFDQVPNARDISASIIKHNLDLFAGSGAEYFGGVFFSDFEEFSSHPIIKRDRALKATQASLASRAAEFSSLIHIHRVAPAPKTSQAAKEAQDWIRGEANCLEGLRSRRVLYQGALYILTVIDHAAVTQTVAHHPLELDLLDVDPTSPSMTGRI